MINKNNKRQILIESNFDNINPKDWENYVLKKEEGTIFQSTLYYNVHSNLEHYKPIVLIAYEERGIVGCLLAVIQKDFIGILGKMTERSIIMGGPLADDEYIAGKLLEAYNAQIKRKAIYSEFRNLNSMKSFENAFLNNGYTYEPHLDIHIDLNQKKENILKNISKNKKRNVSKSTNKGSQFKEINSVEEFKQCYLLINSTYKRIGLPCPSYSYFEVFYNNLSSSGNLKVFIIENNNKIVGTRLELCYKKMIYDWYAGADDSEKNLYPNDFLPYHILMWGNEKSYDKFDFGGAGKPGIPYGVRDHKMKFGGELVEYGRYVKVHKPFLMQIGKIGIKIYKKLKSKI